ncbi:MAG: cyclic nucleotide-binding domain-containing protein [Balneolaceae bacterium]
MLNDGSESIDILPGYIRKFLKEPPDLLHNFHYEDVLEFLQLAEEERYSNGEMIIREGTPVDSAYLIADGKVSLWNENIQLGELTRGSFLGEAFLFKRVNTMAKVQAERETVALKYDRYEVLDFFRKKPKKLFNIFTKNIIEIQQKKISNMNLQLITLKKKLLSEDKW